MKTRFTFLAVALLSLCAYAATTWKAAEATETAAATVLVDDELLTATTVYPTTLKGSEVTFADEEFTHYIQVRNADLPSADNPNGTENEGSTSILLDVKQDIKLTVFYRRQSTAQEETGGVYASNDGKDLKIFCQEDFALADGELTIVKETEDFKYAYVTKTFNLAGGKKYVAAAKGTTIQFFGINHEKVEAKMGPAIELTVASGDIAAELAAAKADNPKPAAVTINLAEGGSYTISASLEIACPLTINGNGATLDATGLGAPVVLVSEGQYAENMLENGFSNMGDIKFIGLNVKALPKQLIYGNKVKAAYGQVLIDNCVVEVAGGNSSIIDFNSGGAAEYVTIKNSTIYGNPQHTGQLYSSQSGTKATEIGLEMQYICLENSTLFNIAYDKNVNTHRQANQKWLTYVVKNNLVVDCGKSGQFVRGLNGGQNGSNPVWNVSGNSFQRIVDGVFTDVSSEESTNDEEEPVSDNVTGVVAFAGDYANGDFTLADCPQNTAKVGDPRWIATVKPAIYIETDLTSEFASLTEYTNWVGASGYATWAAPQVQTNDGKTVYMCERYDGTCDNTGDVFYQVLSGLTPGTYKIELYGSAAYTFGRGFESGYFRSEDNAEDPLTMRTGIALYAESSEGTVSQEIAAYKAVSFSEVSTAVLDGVVVGENGTLKLGMSKSTNYTNWHIVQLKGVTAKVLASDLYANLMAEAKALLESPINANVAEQLKGAMVDDSGFTTAEEYQAAIDLLRTNITAASASAAIYKEVKEALDTYAAKAASLDNDGQAAFDVSAIQKAYDDRTLEDNSSVADVKAAYLAAVRAQTTPGADFTDLVGKAQGDWTGATGIYQNDYVERYGGAEMTEGDIMSQVISGLQPGTYKVELYAVANVAWIEATTGPDITVAYANDATSPMEVYAQTGCDPTQNVVELEAQVGEDGTLQIGMKNIANGGNWFVIQIKALTLVALAAEPAVGEPITLNIESGKDIAAELAAAKADNPKPASVTINLAEGGSYTIGASLEMACPLTINGNGATLDATGLGAPVVLVSEEQYKENMLENEFSNMGDIKFIGLNVKALPKQLIYGNKVKAVYGQVLIDNCVVEVAGGNSSIIDFNSGGAAEYVTIQNSTIYGNPQHTGQLYSSQSGTKATDAGMEMQYICLENSTLFNIAYDKNVNTHRQANQKWLTYVVKKNLVVDCGKSGQFVRGLNGGQNGSNPVWNVSGNSFQRIVDGVFTDVSADESTNDEEEPVKDNVTGAVVFAGDYANGDFTLGNCMQNVLKVGDPRWISETNFYQFVASEWIAGDPGRISPDNVVADTEANTITVSQTGVNNVALIFRSDKEYSVMADEKYFVIKATGLSTEDGASYLWWLNNTNDGGQYKPHAIYEVDGQTVFAWDASLLNIGGNLGKENTIFKDEGGWSTTFGMTLADESVPAVISYIGFTHQIESPVEEAEYAWDANLWVAGDPGRISPDKVVVDEEANTITVSQAGDNNVALLYKTDKVLYVTNAKYFVIQGKGLSTADGKSYLWWLNNTNHGTQVAPNIAVENEDGLVTLVWNIAESGIGESFSLERTYLVGDAGWNTTFGLTLADETVPAVISYIGYEKEDSEIVKQAQDILDAIDTVRYNSGSSDSYYNLSGQKVNRPTRGIYIHNGRKVVVK